MLRYDLFDLAGPLPTFVRGRTVLLGDAAHAMTPDLGRAPHPLLRRNDLEVTLAGHGRVRRRCSQQIVRSSQVAGTIAELRSPVAAGLRDVSLVAVPARLAVWAAGRVQRWSPPS